MKSEVSDLSDFERQDINDLIKKSEETLTRAGSEGAEQSFGLGCLLGGLPLLAVIIILFLTGTLNIIMVFIAVVFGGLGITGAAALMASFARKRRVRDSYTFSVGPEIERHLKKNDIDRVLFDRLAGDITTDESPLRAFIEYQQNSLHS
jgi:hypothetical protein